MATLTPHSCDVSPAEKEERRSAGSVLFVLLVSMLLWMGIGDVHAQHAGSFTQLGFGARGMALGNAQVADVSGRASAYYNPALAPMATTQQLSAAIATMPFDREMQFLQFAAPIRPQAGVAAGVVYAGVSDIDGRDDSGYHTGMLSSSEHGFFVAFGTRFTDRLSGGAALTLYRAQLAGEPAQAEGIAVDLGVTYRLGEQLTLGVAASDLLASYAWETSDTFGAGTSLQTDRFPTRLRAGAGYQLQVDWLLLAEGELRIAQRHQPGTGNGRSMRGDVRLGVAHRPVEGLWLHAGIDRATRYRATRPAAGLALDLPIGQLQVNAEYSAVYETPIQGLAHVITLTLDL